MSCPDCNILASEVARLRGRLEVCGDSPYDGIDCRDQTILLLEQEIQRLKGTKDPAKTTTFRGSTYRQKPCLKEGHCIGCAFADHKGCNKRCPTFDPKIDINERLAVWCHDTNGKSFIWEQA